MSDDLIARRRQLLGSNVPAFYERPLHIVRGQGTRLWDAEGREYLDCYNNVPHVGHGHPRVVEAIAKQAATLNTHTRYLHEGILDYTARLTATLGHGLSQALYVNSGSEANDVALRMAQAATGRSGFIATDDGYHGNTALVSQVSRRPPIGGRAGNVRLIAPPDSLAPLGGSRAAQGEAFARNLHRAIVELEESGFGFAAFIFCPIFANEGLPSVEKGFLDPAMGVIRRARGLVIADEVQAGFGRIGTHFWGHDALGVAPDIVTLGKPMGNGHPVGAAVTRPEVMADFRESAPFFSTFGGNPVSMAAAAATLSVIEDEALVENALASGTHLMTLLRRIRHPRIAEVRGSGLFVGLALGGEGAGAAAGRVVEAMKERGVLIGRNGRRGEVLKLRPPMPFSRDDAAMAAAALEQALAETA